MDVLKWLLLNECNGGGHKLSFALFRGQTCRLDKVDWLVTYVLRSEAYSDFGVGNFKGVCAGCGTSPWSMLGSCLLAKAGRRPRFQRSIWFYRHISMKYRLLPCAPWLTGETLPQRSGFSTDFTTTLPLNCFSKSPLSYEKHPCFTASDPERAGDFVNDCADYWPNSGQEFEQLRTECVVSADLSERQ